MPTKAPDAPAQGTPEQQAPVTEVREPTERTEREAEPEAPLSDPRALFTRKPMPTKRYTFTLPAGDKVTVLLQGLTYTEKAEVDFWSRERSIEDEKEGVKRPSMWGPALIAKAIRNPDGSRPYREMAYIAHGLALAEQLADGEIQRASKAVLDLSGYSDEALEKVGKA